MVALRSRSRGRSAPPARAGADMGIVFSPLLFGAGQSHVDYLPLEGGGRPALAGREGVIALQPPPYPPPHAGEGQGGGHPTPDRLKSIRPSPSRGGGPYAFFHTLGGREL